jgi:hypothetical protein
MCWAGKHLDIPTGMKNGDRATAIATRITARATSLVFMVILLSLFGLAWEGLEVCPLGTDVPTKKPFPWGNGFHPMEISDVEHNTFPYAGITQVRFNGYDLRL